MEGNLYIPYATNDIRFRLFIFVIESSLIPFCATMVAQGKIHYSVICHYGGVVYLLRDQKDSYWYIRTLVEFITVQMIYEIIRNKLNLGLKSDIAFVVLAFVLVKNYLGYFYQVPYFDVLFDIQHFQWVWFYFSIGVLFRRYDLFSYLEKYKNFDSILLLVFALYVCLNINHFKFGFTIISELLVLCGIIVIYIAFIRYNQHTYIMKGFGYMGKHTLEIYLIHLFFLPKFIFIGDYIKELCMITATTHVMQYQLTALTIEIFLSILLSLIIIGLCAAVYEPLKAFPFVYKLFMGREIK